MIKDSLAGLAGHPNVGDIRQCGMMAGIDLVADRAARRPFDSARQMGSAVCQSAMKRGIMIRPLGDVVVLMPAPAMDLATLDKLLTGVIESINETFASAI
jgi:adenosylmethionine-8-amino-7-oxononanoate aminotransferase